MVRISTTSRVALAILMMITPLDSCSYYQDVVSNHHHHRRQCRHRVPVTWIVVVHKVRNRRHYSDFVTIQSIAGSNRNAL